VHRGVSRFEAVSRCGFHGATDEHPGEIGVEELVERASELVVIEVVGFYARGDEMFCGLALEEFLEEVEGSGDEAQAVKDHGLDELTGGQVFLFVGASEEAVDLLDEADLIHDAGDDAEMVDVEAFYRWYLCVLIHAPQNTPRLLTLTCGMRGPNPTCCPLFTRVRGIEILRTSPFGSSRKFTFIILRSYADAYPQPKPQPIATQ
jgi:hypothetical protein